MHSLCTVKGIVWRPPTTLLTAVTLRVRRQPKMVTAAAEHSFFLHNAAWNMMEWCCHTGVNALQTARRPCGDKTMTTCAHYGSSPAYASEPAGRTTSGRIKTNGGMLHYPRKTTRRTTSGRIKTNGRMPHYPRKTTGRTTSGRIKTNGRMLHYPRKTTWHAAFRLHATHNIQG